MARIGLVAAIVAVVGGSLTGCSSLSATSSPQQPAALNIESDPPGAEVHTNQLQTCMTPCALTVPPEDQAIAIAKPGYVPQTVQITTGPPPDHHFWQHPSPTLVPNPLRVVLQPVPKPHHARGPGPAPRTHPAPGRTSDAPPPRRTSDAPPGRTSDGASRTSDAPSAQWPAAEFSAFPSPPPQQ